MKIPVLKLAWLLAPAGLAAFHFGPGQDLMRRDRAGDELALARLAWEDEAFADADACFGAAASALGSSAATAERLRVGLQQARSKLNAAEILDGQQQLEALVAEAEADAVLRDSPLARNLRQELGAASYVAGWIMRLEGAAPDEWRQETERARQQFRLLAERALARSADDEALIHRKNLEATIRLEQLDLSELRALPLPKSSNCNGNCKNLSQRKRQQCQSRCQGKKAGEKEDARKKIKSGGAHLGRRTGSGS